MATSAVPAASTAAASVVAKLSSSSSSQLFPQRHTKVAFRIPLAKSKLVFSSKVVGGPSNGATAVKSMSEVPVSKEKDVESTKEPSPTVPMSEEAISEFMTQVVSLVKLVDSKDIVELQLKQSNCELIIRKKEALPQTPAPAPVVMMPSTTPPAVMPPQFPPPLPATALSTPAGAAGASAAPPPTSPPPAKSAKSSHPPLKSPMAGTFYRCPGPGQPPFVKVGDKVNKGQVLCIIEAMKLMNEIEADQSGTIVEIPVDDGKPVGVDQPLFIIEP